jgi:alkanesulfonate monooxygenase SsuD/methylene tetrahydromethanopterin reductase-like flavin-dependent oxidoreductase (luciferase family)
MAASTTRDLRIGIGYALRYRAPLECAYELSTLATLFPERIDAGFCPGPTLPEHHLAYLGRNPDAGHDPRARASELVAMLRGRWKPTRDVTLEAPPFHRRMALWSLGSSPESAALAGKDGVGYACSLFHRTSVRTPEIVTRYRARFLPTARNEKPAVVIAVAGVCADTEARAHSIASEAMRAGRLRVVCNHSGTPAQWSRYLESLAAAHETAEVMVFDLSTTLSDKIRSLRGIAAAAAMASAQLVARRAGVPLPSRPQIMPAAREITEPMVDARSTAA